ncbi:VMA21-like domain-containing protein [Rhizodiscina lignyota]|uniref:VMA21-like domain-containing protein n=1 Tax=Rhizodiscina lignyota TaxID=1504668 RepID=A0A9P4I9E6_9PEZI|nr:VMA21-like domain-containing protein [Rhizodiscina lignyota]
MTSRFNPRDPASPEKDETVDAAGNSVIAPAVPTPVIVKLLGFTLAMITLPIGTYFATVHSIFKGNHTFAGATAAVVANIVLIGYIIVAFRDDQSEQQAAAGKEKKTE